MKRLGIIIISILLCISFFTSCGSKSDVDNDNNLTDRNDNNDITENDIDDDDEDYEEGTIVIRSVDDLISLRAQVAQQKEEKTELHVVLKTDLDLSDVCGEEKGSWIGIDGFRGIFDGKGHTISGLYISDSSSDPYTAESEQQYVGLFQKTSATIKDLNMKDVFIDSSADYIGSIVAGGYSDIENCSFEGTIIVSKSTSDNETKIGGIAGTAQNIRNCVSSGSITVESLDETLNKLNVGGIVGVSDGDVESCSNNSDITVKGENYTSFYDHDIYVGGIVGISKENVIACSNTASITTTTAYGTGGIIGSASSMYRSKRTDPRKISDCFNSGKVSGFLCAGGIIGVGELVLLNRCGNTGSVEGMYDVGGIVGEVGSTLYYQLSYIENCFNRGEISALEWIGSFELYSGFDTAGQCIGGIVGYCKYNDIINCYNQGTVVNTYCSDDYTSFKSWIGGIAGVFNTHTSYSDKYSNRVINCYTVGNYVIGDNIKAREIAQVAPFGILWTYGESPYLSINLNNNFCLNNIPETVNRTSGYIFAGSEEINYSTVDLSRPKKQFTDGTILSTLQESSSLDDLTVIGFDGYSTPYERTEYLEELSVWVQGEEGPVFDWE